MDVFHLSKLDKVNEKSGKRRQYVALGIVYFHRENGVDGERDPIVPAAILIIGIYVVVGRPPHSRHVDARFLGVHDFLALNNGGRRKRVVKVIKVRCEKVSKLRGRSPDLAEVHEVESDGVLGNVVEAHDFAPVRRKLLQKSVIHLIVGLVYADSRMDEYLSLLQGKTRELVSLVLGIYSAAELFEQLPFAPKIVPFCVFSVRQVRRNVGVVGKKILIDRSRVIQGISNVFKRLVYGPKRFLAAVGSLEESCDLLFSVIGGARGDALDAVVLDKRVGRVHIPKPDSAHALKCVDKCALRQIAVLFAQFTELGKYRWVRIVTNAIQFSSQISRSLCHVVPPASLLLQGLVPACLFSLRARR